MQPTSLRAVSEQLSKAFSASTLASSAWNNHTVNSYTLTVILPKMRTPTVRYVGFCSQWLWSSQVLQCLRWLIYNTHVGPGERNEKISSFYKNLWLETQSIWYTLSPAISALICLFLQCWLHENCKKMLYFFFMQKCYIFNLNFCTVLTTASFWTCVLYPCAHSPISTKIHPVEIWEIQPTVVECECLSKAGAASQGQTITYSLYILCGRWLIIHTAQSWYTWHCMTVIYVYTVHFWIHVHDSYMRRALYINVMFEVIMCYLPWNISNNLIYM